MLDSIIGDYEYLLQEMRDNLDRAREVEYDDVRGHDLAMHIKTIEEGIVEAEQKIAYLYSIRA